MDQRSPCRLNAALAGLLILIAGLVYSPVISQDIGNHDEIEWIHSVDPPNLKTARQIITWEPAKFSTIGYYAPLTALSIMADLRIGDALGNRAAALKATNLGLHILNALLAFAFIQAIGFGPWIAFAVAAVFCVHPLQVGSVAWLAERKNLLMAACFLTALLCYHKYRKHGGLQWYASVLVFYVLALAGKPSAVALGPCLFIADWFLIDCKITLKSVLRVAPLLAIGIVWTLAAIATEGSGGGAPPLFERLLMVPYKIGFMLSKFLVPINLTHIYAPVPADVAPFLWWGAMLIFAAVAVIVVAVHRTSPIWIVLWGIAFYLLNLIPSLGIVPFSGMKEMYVADHYQYLSLIAASLLVVLGADHLIRTYAVRKSLAVRRIVLCATVLGLGLLSFHHLRIWTNAETLWTHVISKNPASLTAHYDYGHYLDDHGRYREAVIQYELAIAIDSRAYRPYNNLGLVLMRFGKLDAAAACFRKCAELNPAFSEPHVSLAKICFFQGKYIQALEHCRKAAALGGECSPAELEKAVPVEPEKQEN